MLTLQLIELLSLRFKLLLESILLLLGDLLVIDQFIACGLPFCFLLCQPILRLGVFFEETNNCPLEEIHYVITHLHHQLI